MRLKYPGELPDANEPGGKAELGQNAWTAEILGGVLSFLVQSCFI